MMMKIEKITDFTAHTWARATKVLQTETPTATLLWVIGTDVCVSIPKAGGSVLMDNPLATLRKSREAEATPSDAVVAEAKPPTPKAGRLKAPPRVSDSSGEAKPPRASRSKVSFHVTEEDILGFMQASGKPVPLKEICDALNIEPSGVPKLRELLSRPVFIGTGNTRSRVYTYATQESDEG